MKNRSQDSRPSGRDLNPGPPEYEAGKLTIRPRRSVAMPCELVDMKMETMCFSETLISTFQVDSASPHRITAGHPVSIPRYEPELIEYEAEFPDTKPQRSIRSTCTRSCS
jgi:hypothetical protein